MYTSTSQQAYTLPSNQADPWDPRATSASLLHSGSSSRAGTSAFVGGPRCSPPVAAASSLPALLYGPEAPDAKPDPGPGPGSYELNRFHTIQAGLGRGSAGCPRPSTHQSSSISSARESPSSLHVARVVAVCCAHQPREHEVKRGCRHFLPPHRTLPDRKCSNTFHPNPCCLQHTFSHSLMCAACKVNPHRM